MSQLNLPSEGGCRRGRKMKISAKPLLTMACHCTGCQTVSPSAFFAERGGPLEGFEITSGEPVTVGGSHGAMSHHYFCPHRTTRDVHENSA